MEITTIRVSKETRIKLNLLRYLWGTESMDKTINKLIEEAKYDKVLDNIFVGGGKSE